MEQAESVHYERYGQRPFPREARAKTTLLFGGLTWKHEKLIEGAMARMGYDFQVMVNPDYASLQAGKEYADTGACCPTYFTTGSLIETLKRKEKAGETRSTINDKYLMLTAGACGPCRFGQYRASYELALQNAGFDGFRLFLFEQDNLDQGATNGGGLDVNLPFTLALVHAILIGDLIHEISYQVRPYEITRGATDRWAEVSTRHLDEKFRSRPLQDSKLRSFLWYLGSPYFVEALRKVHKDLSEVKVDRLQVKPKAKITGEFWVQTTEGAGNYDIHKFLEAEGAEALVEPVATWLAYMMRTSKQDALARKGLRKGTRKSLALIGLLEKVFSYQYNRLRKAVGNMPHRLVDQYELKRLAAPYFHNMLGGGEGDMLVAKAIHYHSRKLAHMIVELSPFGCLPNTQSIGAMSEVVGRHPDMLYAPVEIKGDAAVHALSRVQMVLSEAKLRAKKEVEDTLASSGLSMQQVKEYVEAHPSLQRATTLIPRTPGLTAEASHLIRYVAARRMSERAGVTAVMPQQSLPLRTAA